MYRNIKYTMF